MTDDQQPHPVAGRIAESVREQLDEGGRHQILTGSGTVCGALLALGGGTGFALAEEPGTARCCRSSTTWTAPTWTC